MSQPGPRNSIDIAGAGLCGSLLAILLARRGLDVRIFERRRDPRRMAAAAGRSINLALSARGMRALRGAGVFDRIEPLLLPMCGRLLHAENGSTEFLPYGQRQNEQIYSVSRAELNRLLIDEAEQSHAVPVTFRQEALAWDSSTNALQMRDADDQEAYSLGNKPIIAADGAGSVIRRSLQESLLVEATESLLPHGYKELAVPATADGGFQLDPSALHIWPRGEFMLIALPNPGGDFTLTLFLPVDGADSFAALDSAARVDEFFGRYFPDIVPLIPQLAATFLDNPVGVLGTVRCHPWHVDGRLLLLGDAAHAIVPFHGQGMNLAFEDCMLLDNILATSNYDTTLAFARFDQGQNANANAIADMALENYVEMRDTVRDPGFLLRRELSFELERRLPDYFIPRYAMVMFHDNIPYAVAQQRGDVQQRLLLELTRGHRTLQDIDLDAAAAVVRAALNPLVA
ncbi:MAG: NAD(P)/FAD-dependent oxidoreductase [Woeseia sp.]